MLVEQRYLESKGISKISHNTGEINLKEDNLSDYSSELISSGNYPWIKYDPSNGYYVDSNDDNELIDKDSVDKVINMLKYNT